ncbi:MAG: DUF5711 family protein [Eubacterium sp.]|nr:DUF5711 family protein [Eubacterium sp.]
MPNKETQTPRRRKVKSNKAQRTRTVIWAVIILTVVVLAVLKIWEVDFNSIKRNISKNSENGIIASVSDSIYPYSLDSSKNIEIVPQNDKLNILTDISTTILNPTTGKKEYGESHGYSNPIMRTAGSYFVIYDQGADRFRLDTLTKKVYENENTESPVLTADVASNGSVIYALKSGTNKSLVTVINKNRSKLLENEIKGSYVVYVAIDSSGRHCAYATVSSENAVLVTTVHTINVGDKKERGEFKFEGSHVLDLRYCGANLYVVCDDSVSYIGNQHKLKSVFGKSEVNTCCFNYTSEGELVYVYSKYSSANENILAYINENGKVKTSVELSQRPKYVSSASKEMTVLFPDKIVTYSLKTGEEKGSAPCDDSVIAAHKLSTKCFICRHQVIDITEIKAKEK